jgi:hypothetical protein
MGSATSIPAAAPTVVSGAAAATTALKGHTHHDAPVIPRFARGVKAALLLIVAVSLLGSAGLLPVAVHMLLITAATIYVGSHFALKCWKVEGHTEETKHEHAGGGQEQMQTRDAMMFPLIGSCVLFSLYCVYKLLPAAWVNAVIKLYFFIFGCIVLSQKLAQIAASTLPEPLVHRLLRQEFTVPNPLWAFERVADFLAPLFSRVSALIGKVEKALMPVLKLIPGSGYADKSAAAAAKDAAEAAAAAAEVPPPPSSFWTSASLLDLLSLAAGVAVSIVYVSTGSWLASNLFGLAFSVQGIELLSLGSYLNGCILLCGLFVYDVFWVFGTDVMVTVAKSFDAPIKLLFPQATWWNGEGSENRPSMLGLGDIVIPGIFIALLLRYDIWRHIQSIRAKALKAGKSEFTKDEEHELDCLYCHVRSPAHGSSFRATFFHANLVAYVLGLATTVLVMYAFQAAQPALLYLVPACLGASIALGALRRRGELKTLWSYTENEDDKASALEAEEKLKMAPATAAAAEAKHNDEGADAGVAAKAFSSQVAAEAEAAAAKAAAASSAAPVEDAVAASASASSTDGVAVQRPSVRKSSSAKKKGGSSKKKKSARAE